MNYNFNLTAVTLINSNSTLQTDTYGYGTVWFYRTSNLIQLLESIFINNSFYVFSHVASKFALLNIDLVFLVIGFRLYMVK